LGLIERIVMGHPLASGIVAGFLMLQVSSDNVSWNTQALSDNLLPLDEEVVRDFPFE
jgi:hypothetical protein